MGLHYWIVNTLRWTQFKIPPIGGIFEDMMLIYSAIYAGIYNPDDPDEISGDRYILSENDFATYGLASEVLGE